MQAELYEREYPVEVESTIKYATNVQEVKNKRVKNEVGDKQVGEIEFVSVNEELIVCETSESLRNVPQTVLLDNNMTKHEDSYTKRQKTSDEKENDMVAVTERQNHEKVVRAKGSDVDYAVKLNENDDNGIQIKTEREESGVVQFVKQEVVDEYDEAINIDYRVEGVKNETKCEPEFCGVDNLGLEVMHFYENENQDIVKHREEAENKPPHFVKPEVLDECDDEIETIDCENSNETNLEKNSQKSKKRNGHLQCQLCPEVFRTKFSLTVHENVHTKERLFECSVCGKCYRLKPLLKQHIIRVHNRVTRETCTICSNQFKGMDSLKRHMKTIHSICKEGTENTEVKADNTPTTEDTDEEQEWAKPGLKHECQKCFKAFTREYDLTRHHWLVHENNARQFTCGSCTKVFTRKSHLVQHERTHTNERPFPCGFCDMRFKQKGTMMSHVARMHRQAAEPNASDVLRCPVCDKTFWKKNDFTIHVRIHTDERPYLCESCGKAFRTNHAIKRHMINMHDKGNQELKCPVCSKVFKWKDKLLLHERTHTQERPYACGLCEKRFNQKVLLRMHNKKYHDADGALNQ